MTGCAVITGASGAIGGALAHALADAGHDLIVVGRSESSVASLLAAHSGRHLQADLLVEDDVQRVCMELRRLERVAVAVHAAGRLELGATATLPVESLDNLYRMNLRAPYLLTQALLPGLRAAEGQIVFVNSSAGARPAAASTGAYAATKHGLRAVADAVRAEENANGVRVLSVYPGRIAGPLQETLHAAEDKSYDAARLLQPADISAAIMTALALPRTAEVTDIHIRPMRPPAQ